MRKNLSIFCNYFNLRFHKKKIIDTEFQEKTFLTQIHKLLSSLLQYFFV